MSEKQKRLAARARARGRAILDERQQLKEQLQEAQGDLAAKADEVENLEEFRLGLEEQHATQVDGLEQELDETRKKEAQCAAKLAEKEAQCAAQLADKDAALREAAKKEKDLKQDGGRGKINKNKRRKKSKRRKKTKRRRKSKRR